MQESLKYKHLYRVSLYKKWDLNRWELFLSGTGPPQPAALM